MDQPKQPNIKLLLSLFIFGILLFLSLLIYLFYLISLLLTIWGSILILILSLYGLARLVIRLSVFPGSFWLWKRSIESHFCREMSLQLLQKVQELQICLDLILDNCSEADKIEFIDRSIDSTTYAKRMISTIIDSYNVEKASGTLTAHGESLVDLLTNFQQSMQNCKILAASKETDLWSFIDEAVEGKEWADVISEEYPSNHSAHHALEICQALQTRLLETCGAVNLFRKIRRFLFDSTLGTLNQMRNELESRYSCEQFFVPSGNIELDCMMVFGSDSPESPVILLCNPNAGLYEFSYYQSEWLEYYVSVGLNVLLWNYRGYGRSKGSPSPSALKIDGEAVISYLHTERNVKIIGVHGESLGGAVASHIARVSEVDFLFVDRSFSKLNELVQFSFGKWARHLLFIVSQWSLDSAQDYLYVNCYKILSADPHDVMINDLASIKSGVAVKLIETRGLEIAEGIVPAQLDLQRYFHILSGRDTQSMLEAVGRIMEYVMRYIRSDIDRNGGMIDVTGTSCYQALGKDHDGIDEETINSLLFRVFNVLDGLDAGGKALSGVGVDRNALLSMKLWIMVLDIWGSFLPLEPTDINLTRVRALERLEHSIDELKLIFTDHEYATNVIVVDVCKDCKVLEKCLSKIMVYLKNQIPGKTGDGELSSGDELSTFRHHFEYGKAGYLLPLGCGHSGRYSNLEVAVLETHLTRIGFIK